MHMVAGMYHEFHGVVGYEQRDGEPALPAFALPFESEQAVRRAVNEYVSVWFHVHGSLPDGGCCLRSGSTGFGVVGATSVRL
jgi:hypothetical protein